MSFVIYLAFEIFYYHNHNSRNPLLVLKFSLTDKFQLSKFFLDFIMSTSKLFCFERLTISDEMVDKLDPSGWAYSQFPES